jgi:hypothetical protein
MMNAQTVLQQLGGRMFLMMTGAKQFVAGADTLAFRIGSNAKRISKVAVTLGADDLYTVTFYRAAKAVAVREGIYCDQLQAVFTTETGLYTRL